jgi:hypothetical protein
MLYEDYVCDVRFAPDARTHATQQGKVNQKPSPNCVEFYACMYGALLTVVRTRKQQIVYRTSLTTVRTRVESLNLYIVSSPFLVFVFSIRLILLAGIHHPSSLLQQYYSRELATHKYCT